MTGKAAQLWQVPQQAALTYQMTIPFQTLLGAAGIVPGGFKSLAHGIRHALRDFHGRITTPDTRKTRNLIVNKALA